MSTEYKDLFTTINGQKHLLNPADGKYYPIEDARDKLTAANASKTPEELAFEQAFEKRRGLGVQKDEQDDEGPVPGGVGYGAFFNNAYKVNYHTGTVIAVDIICPQKAGGNVNTWLYLTETNRTAKGVEALVYYLGQSELGFKIFDWAREDHWQVTLSAAQLKDYLSTKFIDFDYGDRQVLSLQNQTFIVDTPQGKRWKNVVYLYNYKFDCYSLVYEYEYESTEEEQKGDWIGSWGPIVETFQDSYEGTNLLGFSGTFMQERDEQNKWTNFHMLTDDLSYIRNDGKGFKLAFLEPNYSFAVE